MSIEEQKETKEQKFSCGCHIVDGELVVQCTQAQPGGEISSSHHAHKRPFSAKCFRLAVEDQERQEYEARKAKADEGGELDPNASSTALGAGQQAAEGEDSHLA